MACPGRDADFSGLRGRKVQREEVDLMLLLNAHDAGKPDTAVRTRISTAVHHHNYQHHQQQQ